MSTMALAAAMACLLAGAWLVLVCIATWRLLDLPRQRPRPVPSDLGIAYEDVCVAATDGVQLRGWFFARDGAPVIIYCAGRGSGVNNFDFRHALLFHQGGYQVLMLDWRGMGASDGDTSMAYWEGLDLRAAVTYTRQRAGPAPVGAFGVSLGAAVLYLHGGAIPEIAAIAGECGFADYQEMIAQGMVAAYSAPLLLARPLAWSVARLSARVRGFALAQANPVAAIGAISPRPVMIIHGQHDRHVLPAAAERLYAAAGEPKELWITPAGHTGSLMVMGDDFGQRVLEFFDRWLK